MQDQFKEFLKTFRRNQSQLKYGLFLLLLFVLSTALMYRMAQRVNLPSVQNDTRLTPATQTGDTVATATDSGQLAPGSQQAGSPTTQVNAPIRYTVQKGDTLWIIAEKHYGNGSLYSGIAAVNGLRSSTYIQAGQELIIPAKDVAAARTVRTVAKVKSKTVQTVNVTKAKTVTTQKQTYIVQKGDSLWKISTKKYQTGKAWPKIYRANTQVIGKNPNLIYPKQKLVIPARTSVTKPVPRK